MERHIFLAVFGRFVVLAGIDAGMGCGEANDIARFKTGIPGLLVDADDTNLSAQALADPSASSDIEGLSLGGGTVTTEACRRMIRKNTTCFYLKASVDTLVHNLETWPGERPMLNGGKNLRSRVEELLAERAPIYEKTAHHIINVDGDDYLAAAVDIVTTL